jgi:uncharacterized membrane protein
MYDVKRPIYLAILILSLWFIISAFIAPFIENRSVKSFIYGFFALFCHQEKSLCLELAEKKMPICSRCLGMHLGFITTLAVIFIRSKKKIQISKNNKKSIVLLFVLSWLTAALTSYLSNKGYLSISHSRRIIIGLLLGFATALLLCSLIEKMFKTYDDQQHP